MENIVISLADLINVVSWSMLLLGAVAVFAAAVTQGATGLGFGMVASPILMIIEPVFVPGAPLLLAMLVSTLVVIREWQSIDWRGFSIAMSGRVTGTVLAGLTMAVIPVLQFGLLFGLLVLGAVVLSSRGWKALPSTRNLISGGFASGYMGTVTAIGAPPIALVYQNQPAAVIRATLSMFFAVGAAISIATLVIIDKFMIEQLLISIIFLPAMLAGVWISGKVAPMVQGPLARNLVLALSATTAFILVVKSGIALYQTTII